ncbi:MAG: substrate-binding domain-containing protein [Verrucomicrobiota bacterium]
MNFRHAAEVFSGASNFVEGAGLNWQLLPLNFGFEEKLIELAESGRLCGAIGTFVSDEWLRGLSRRKVAAVNLFNFSEIKTVPSICLDDAAIGTSAASHLIEHGAKEFAFIGRDHAYFNQIRRKHFAINCPHDNYRALEPRLSRRQQLEQLQKLKKPVGVLCSSDRIARELCNEASLVGLKVGKDILVIGIGNDPTESTFAGIGLSSFDIPARRIGFLAAEMMKNLLNSKNTPPGSVEHATIAAKLIARASSLPSRQSQLAERAERTIEDSFWKADFDVAQLCRRLGVSRRILEMATREGLDKSPYQMISDMRLGRAKELLLQTNQTITRTGEDCGYPEPHHFSAWFKKHTQMSPRKFRDMHRIKGL